MSPAILFSFVIGYFLILLTVAYFTSRNSNNDSFFIGNRNSNWMLVAFGMIGTSLSGVTFVSVPGGVGNMAKLAGVPNALAYFQVVIGYFFGYIIIAYILLPLYYRLNLTSIYNYLKQRFGVIAYKTGASFFILSRSVGATARLYLVINVLHIFILQQLNIPFYATVIVVLLMILLYTFEGGVKTIVYTDTLQTLLMITGLIVAIIYILSNLGISVTEAMNAMEAKSLTKVFNMDVNSKGFFLKQIIGGAFITIAMTGLDQEMMQKNISVKNLKDSQKNMLTFSTVIVFVNLLFLLLGGLLYLYAYQHNAGFASVMEDGKPVIKFMHGNLDLTGDRLFPSVALGLISAIPWYISVIFIIGLISALFPSADGALTALTSSFCIDILGLKNRADLNEKQRKKIRLTVHFTMAFVFMLLIFMFKWIGSRSIIDKILDLAGYTYGPLLGLFTFGIFTKRVLANTYLITLICIASPLLCYLLSVNSAKWFGGYNIGIELLIINGFLTFLGLLMISKKSNK
ncbi:MAG: sodium:solute symporter [Ferruginibacter sp.]